MQKLLAWVGVLAIAVYVLKIDLNRLLGFLKLPNFNLPNMQQTQGQNQQSESQIPQVTGPNPNPSPTPIPMPSQSPNQGQWGVGFKGELKTPFGSTKNEINLGNPDFTQDDKPDQ